MAEGMASENVKGIREVGSATVVDLAGEIDMHHTMAVHRALTAAWKKPPVRLVINLEAVAYVDSSGIGALVEVLRAVKKYDGRLHLCGMNDRVHSVFEITKLDNFFQIHDTEAEALTA